MQALTQTLEKDTMPGADNITIEWVLLLPQTPLPFTRPSASASSLSDRYSHDVLQACAACSLPWVCVRNRLFSPAGDPTSRFTGVCVHAERLSVHPVQSPCEWT